MTPRARVRSAWGMTALVYLVSGVVTLPLAWVAAGALGRVLAGFPASAIALSSPGGAPLLYEAFERVAAYDAGTLTLIAEATLILWLLLQPWLSQSWLAALAAPRTLREALGAGLRRYIPAVALAILMGVMLVVLLAAGAVLPFAGHLITEGGDSARTHDLVVLGLCAPAVVLVLMWATWNDLARAVLAAQGQSPWRCATLSLQALTPTAVLAYLFWAGVGLACGAVGAWALGVPMAHPALPLLASQAATLARTFVRSRWLAGAVCRVEGLAPIAVDAWKALPVTIHETGMRRRLERAAAIDRQVASQRPPRRRR
ncbi:MAG: hypothetical protein KC543_08360 [Myxococcales bacterium]|nr:hypothetical protein [Myxococcales bacterium]